MVPHSLSEIEPYRALMRLRSASLRLTQGWFSLDFVMGEFEGAPRRIRVMTQGEAEMRQAAKATP